MLWTCATCTCRYAVGAPRCPECGSTDRSDMPKITTSGVSYAGHLDASPEDVDQPDWQPEPEQAEQSEPAEPEQPKQQPSPRPRSPRKDTK